MAFHLLPLKNPNKNQILFFQNTEEHGKDKSFQFNY